MPVQIVRVVDSGGGYTTVLASDGNTYTIRGNAAWRNNNPGNLRPGSLTNGLGAIGTASAGGNGQFLVFPDYQTGLAAQRALQFNTPSYSNLTIAEAIQKYAPPGDSNDSAAYAQRLATAIGVPVTTRLADLSPQQQTAYLAAQQGVENNGPGTIEGAAGVSVPPELTGLFSNGGHSLPPANIPTATTNLAGPDDRPSMASLYGAPPAPLTPPQAPPLLTNSDGWASGLKTPANFYDPNNTAPPQNITDMNYPVGGLPPPNLPLDLPAYAMPPLPISRPATPPQAPPVPMATPSWLQPTASPPAASAQHLVNLNGKMVPVGIYPSTSNPGSTFTVSDDGTGRGVVKANDPGLMNVAKMGQGTVAGSILGQKLADAGTQIQQGAGQALDNAGAGLNSLKDQAGAAASNLASGAGSLLSNLFGGAPKPPSVPAPPPVPSFLPTGNVWTNPLVKPVAPPAPTTLPSFMPSGSSWATPYNTVPPAAPPTPTGTPPGTVLPLTANMPPPMPMPPPPWLAPVMPTSATFGTDPVSRLIAASKIGPAIQFLGGAQNNYGYITAAPGMTQQQTHNALMAQQHNPQMVVNGQPVTAMNGQPARANNLLNSFGMPI